MGEIAEDINEGFRCAICADIMYDMKSPGHPRVCQECKEEDFSEVGEFDED
jgi:hypothetical protein